MSNKFQFDFTPNSNPIPKISEPDASEFLKDKSEKQLILSIFQVDDMGHYVWMVFERVLFDVMTWLSMGVLYCMYITMLKHEMEEDIWNLTQ